MDGAICSTLAKRLGRTRGLEIEEARSGWAEEVGKEKRKAVE
jgi:hypothetical protein